MATLRYLPYLPGMVPILGGNASTATGVDDFAPGRGVVVFG
jgi:hypothetical protein